MIEVKYEYDAAAQATSETVEVGASNFVEFPWSLGESGQYIQLVNGFSRPAWTRETEYKFRDMTRNFYVDFRLYGENVWSPRPLQRRSVFTVPLEVLLVQYAAFQDYEGTPPVGTSVIRVAAPVGSRVKYFRSAIKAVFIPSISTN